MEVSIMANTKQIEQITQFLSAYPKDVVEAGIEAWRTGEMPMEGMVADVPLAGNYNELTPEAKQFIKDESKKMPKIMPLCKCGKQLSLVQVCPSCQQGAEGYKSKFICSDKSCRNEEFFKETVQEKTAELNNQKGRGGSV